MSEFDYTKVDIYEIIGIENGVDATEKQIKTAYNAMALKTHPDRHPYDPSAGDKFDLLRRSYEFIRSPENRATYNAHLKLKEERQRQVEAQDDDMKRMIKKLVDDENRADSRRTQRVLPSLSSIARQKSTAYVESLQRQGIIGPVSGIYSSVKMAKAPNSTHGKVGISTEQTQTTEFDSAKKSGFDSMNEIRQRSLVLKWRSSSKTYNPIRATEAGIIDAVSRWGEVVSVHLRSSATSDKGKAVVVFQTSEQAVAADRGLLGDAMFQSEPLEVSSVYVSDLPRSSASEKAASRNGESTMSLNQGENDSDKKDGGRNDDNDNDYYDNDDDDEPLVDLEIATLARLKAIQERIQATVIIDE